MVRIGWLGVITFVTSLLALCQNANSQQAASQPGTSQQAASQQTTSQQADDPETSRILGIVPNYGTLAGGKTYEPLTSRQKFKLAGQDTFDPGAFALVGIFAGEAQLSNANRAFGQGAAGFGRYYAANFGDLMIGNYMAEAIFPSMLHEDPRYFARRTGSGWSRLRCAVGQIFWTHTDSGGSQFNYSEIVGNSVTVAISNAYYENHRNVGDAVSRLSLQLGVDMGTNILKEFWPDVRKKLPGKHTNGSK
jgi:hypothetical protein